MRRHYSSVYRIYDREGHLLYVGSTVGLEYRIQQHRHSIPEFASYAAVHYDTPAEAQRAERAAIYNEAPLLNRCHNHKRFARLGQEFIPVEHEVWPEGLAGTILQRMAELGLTSNDVAKAAGVVLGTFPERLRLGTLDRYTSDQLESILNAVGLNSAAVAA